MHRESEQSPQPDRADASHLLKPSVQRPPDPASHNDPSGERSRAEAIGLRINSLESKMEGIPLPDDPLGEAGQKYDALVGWYQKHIAGARARLDAMGQ